MVFITAVNGVSYNRPRSATQSIDCRGGRGPGADLLNPDDEPLVRGCPWARSETLCSGDESPQSSMTCLRIPRRLAVRVAVNSLRQTPRRLGPTVGLGVLPASLPSFARAWLSRPRQATRGPPPESTSAAHHVRVGAGQRAWPRFWRRRPTEWPYL